MTTTISVPTRLSGKVLLRKVLLICGTLSSILYIAINIIVPMQYEGYNPVSQTISELSAIGAPTRQLWVSFGFAYTLLVAAFGWGVWLSAALNRSLRIAGVLVIVYGLVGIAWPFAPMHQREVLAAGGGTLSDTMHIAMSIVTVFLMFLAIGFGATVFGKRFRYYSIATILILLALGALTGIDAPRVQANLPTPWLGILERVMIGTFMLWVVVLSIRLLRKEKGSDSISKANIKTERASFH